MKTQKHKTKLERDMRRLEQLMHYVPAETIPHAIPTGEVLVHNHVMHSVRTRCGIRGFRAWTQTLNERLEQCDCGWSALPHYRVKDELRMARQRGY